MRAGIYTFDALLLIGYLCGFSDLVGKLGIPGKIPLLMGGFALAYCLTATGVFVAYSVFQALMKHFGADLDPGRRQALNTTGNLLMAAPFAVMGYGTFIERTNFQVRDVEVPVSNLPGGLDGLRILQISDIHLSPFLSEADLARVIDAAAGLHPHLAVVTGDLISSRGDPLDVCIRQLARLKAEAGVFGCMGNHERYAKAESYAQQAAARVGIRFLRGESQVLRFGDSNLNLAGVDYQSHAGGKRHLEGAERMVVPGAMNVLLSHNPDVFPVAKRQGYNLVLSGHTHGGQITVEILDQAVTPARFFTNYVYGLYGSPAASAYVTRGIGTIGVPVRIGAPPEISILRLRKA
jgi:predicted MPP superfamily phosphohydrolase